MEQGQKAKIMTIHPSYEELFQLYVTEDKTAIQIASIYGMHHTTLLRRLRERGIRIRTNSDIHKGKIYSNETRKKISESSKGNTRWLGRNHNEATRARLRDIHLGTKLPKETKMKMSATHKRLFEDPEHKSRILEAVRMGMTIHPNKPETIVLGMLNEIDLGNWEFTGDGKVVMGGRIPDFFNTNGHKKIIEVFGDYWHGERARCYEETEAGRIELFKGFGYSTLVIWESELKEPERVKGKIREFVKGGR